VFLTEAEALKLGVLPDMMTSKHPEASGQGYKAGVEVFYQLRCLNLLRQTAHGMRNTKGDTAIGE
jgi:hypothetical protein